MSQPVALDVSKGLTDAWTAVITWVPKFIAFLVILFIGWLIAKAIAKAVDVVLERVGFDKAVERGGIAKAMSKSKYDASDLIAKIAYYIVLLFTLQLAFGVFGPNPISDIIRSVIAFLPKAIVAMVIVVVTAAIANVVKGLITDVLGGLSYGKVLANVAYVFILGLGIIAALNQIDVAVTVTEPILLTVLAIIAGVAIVGVGGGLVRPMQQRWERWLSTAEQESSNVKSQVQSRTGSSDAPTMQHRTVDVRGTGVYDRTQDEASQGGTQGGSSTYRP